MADIHVLPESLRNRIAAGEVLERPASAVKELLENAVDAGAESIDVQISEGGQSLIRVADNGSGISADELQTAVLRHATSKIHDLDDIYRITSLGFRGEALPSIAAVSRMTIASRREGSDNGYEISVDAGSISGERPCSTACGTVVTVRDLYYNTPARRKFLKSPRAETTACREQFIRLALPHPEIAFSFDSEGGSSISLPAHEDMVNRITAVYGRDIGNHLLPVEYSPDNTLAVSGFVVEPPEAKANSTGIHLFLNRRWFQSKSLINVVRQAFEGVLPARRYPLAYIFVGIDPAEVDVNVHPTKREVRFAEERKVCGAVHRAITMALRNTPVASVSTVSGESFPHNSQNSAKPEGKNAAESGGSNIATTIDDEAHEASPDYRGASLKRSSFNPADNMTGLKEKFKRSDKNISHFAKSLTSSHEHGATPAITEGQGGLLELPAGNGARRFRILGQVHDSYLIVEDEEGIIMVDQHALHERLIYDALKAGADAPSSQRLLVPAVVEITPEEEEVFCELADDIRALGFEVEPFGERTLSIQAIPTVTKGNRAAPLLRDILAELESTGIASDPRDPLLKSISCKAAVKAGDRLPDGEVIALLDKWHDQKIPGTCPHGRPFCFRITLADLQRRFHRT